MTMMTTTTRPNTRRQIMSTDWIAIPRPPRLSTSASIRGASNEMTPRPAAGQLTDEQLAVIAQGGSVPAFAELVARNETRVYNFVLGRGVRHADAEDVSQETFLRCWRHIHRYRPRFRFSTWMLTIASRLAIDHLRSRSSNPGHHSSELELIGTAQTRARPHEEHSSSNLWAIAATLLTDEQHSALWLRYAEGLSNQEVARVLGRTAIGVRVMLHRARSLLARHLSAENAEGGLHERH